MRAKALVAEKRGNGNYLVYCDESVADEIRQQPWCASMARLGNGCYVAGINPRFDSADVEQAMVEIAEPVTIPEVFKEALCQIGMS